MKYTREQRHKIYLAAYDYFSEYPEGATYICWCIEYVSGEYSVDINDFPEFLAHRPDDADVYRPWWPDGDRETREKVFKQIIEETR
jgi:hypothetical protein